MIFEVLTAVTIKSTVSWDVMLISERGSPLAAPCVCLLLAWLLFDPEDGGTMFLQNISKLFPDYTVSHPRRYCTSFIMSLFSIL
jgi:hypothetical protein